MPVQLLAFETICLTVQPGPTASPCLTHLHQIHLDSDHLRPSSLQVLLGRLEGVPAAAVSCGWQLIAWRQHHFPRTSTFLLVHLMLRSSSQGIGTGPCDSFQGLLHNIIDGQGCFLFENAAWVTWDKQFSIYLNSINLRATGSVLIGRLSALSDIEH